CATRTYIHPLSLHDALPIFGSFAEKTLVAEGQCTKVREADPAVVGLLGCGVMAGIGAAINTGEVTRGKTVAVIGFADLRALPLGDRKSTRLNSRHVSISYAL